MKPQESWKVPKSHGPRLTGEQCLCHTTPPPRLELEHSAGLKHNLIDPVITKQGSQDSHLLCREKYSWSQSPTVSLTPAFTTPARTKQRDLYGSVWYNSNDSYTTQHTNTSQRRKNSKL